MRTKFSHTCCILALPTLFVFKELYLSASSTVLRRLEPIWLETFFVKWLVKLWANVVIDIQGADTIFWNVGGSVLLTRRLARLVADNALLGHLVGPDLARLALPLVGVIHARTTVFTSCFHLVHFIVRCSIHSLKEMRQSFLRLFLGLKLESSQVCHLFLQIGPQYVVCQFFRAISFALAILVSPCAAVLPDHVLLSYMLLIYLNDLF